jgi:hypothetical protein
MRTSIAALLCLCAPAPPQGGRALAPVGPLGYWSGDAAADAPDATGNGFHGKCSPGAAPSKEAAPVKTPNAGSIGLDGASGVVTIADAPALRLAGDLTLSFWKRRSANAKDWSRIVGKGNGGQRNFGLWQAPDGDNRLLFQQYDAGGRPVIDLFSPAATELNRWYHLVVVVRVSYVALYVNGELAAQGTRNGDPGLAADPLTFGHAGFHTFWAGQVDDVRLYDRALSMSEIVYLCSGQGAPAPPTDLKAGPDGSLQWTASATPAPAGTATYYLVKRSATAGKDYAPAATFMTATAFVDPAPEPGKTWHYVVTAVNTGGESVPSNEVAVAVKAK